MAITSQLLPIFRFQRILGWCPMVFHQRQVNNGIKYIDYDFTLLSVESILSTLSGIFIISSFLLGVFQGGVLGFQLFPSSNSWPEKVKHIQDKRLSKEISSFNGILLSSFEVIYTLICIAEFINVWWTSQRLSKWLNKWNEIDEDLRNASNKTFNVDLSSFLKYFSILYIGIPTFIFGTLLFVENIDMNFPLWIFISFICCYLTTMCIHAEDVKTVLMLHTLELSFRQVRMQIEYNLLEGDSSTEVSKVSRSNQFKKWYKILIKIRKQAVSIGKYIALHQLLSIAILIYFASSAFYIAVDTIGTDMRSLIYLTLTFITLSLLRIFIKIIFAVRVVEEERKIAGFVKDLEISEKFQEYNSGLSKLYELLTDGPTEISLNGYVSLNNSLILKIFGQILTQFIVLMQLQNSNRK